MPDEIDFEPLDTWGEITRIVESDIGITVHLKDQAGRSVKIDRLDEAHGVTKCAASENIGMYLLDALTTRV